VLIEEMRKVKKETKDEEIRERLTIVMKILSEGNIIKGCPIKGRTSSTAILWKEKLIIWGGVGGTLIFYNDGAIYDIEKGTWQEMKESPISGRVNYGWVHSGKRIIIWGGADGGTTYYNDGAIYDIERGTWTKMKDAPIEGRQFPVFVLRGQKANCLGWCLYYTQSSI